MSVSLEILKKQLDIGFLPQAYLFWGDDNDAKENTISFLMSSLLGGQYRMHPNFLELAPHGDKLPGSISADDVRAMRARAFEKPFETQDRFAARNVFLIRSIDRLSPAASPMLLKLLEEPPAHVFFLATTTDRNAVLPTIRSRFLMLRFANDMIAQKTPHADAFKKLSYADRFKKIPSIIEKNELSILIREAIAVKNLDVRRCVATDNANVGSLLDTMNRMLFAYRLLSHPTVNKRLLGEYCAMLY